MSDAGFISDRSPAQIRVAAEPLCNALCSLCILAQDVENTSPWVARTKQAMGSEEHQLAEVVCSVPQLVRGSTATEVPQFIEELTSRDAESMVSVTFEHLAEKTQTYLPKPVSHGALHDEETYVTTVRALMSEKPDAFDEREVREEFALLADPKRYKARIVDALGTLWERYLAPEWPHALEMINTSVQALRSVAIPGDTFGERLRYLAKRDYIPEDWISLGSEIEELIYIPSPHIGPYLLMIDHTPTTARLVGRAWAPEGASVASVELDRSEILIRLEAISDETRLRILELAATSGTLTTADVMDRLQLSQSSASRHLTQLAATGMLTVDASEKTKRYRLNQRRIEETWGSLSGLLKR